jgi:hypothetical protein
MNPKKTEKLRNLLNKRFSIDYYYTEKEVNPDFRIKYIVYFTISRKVNLNCFIRVSDLSLINSDFTNVIKWDRLSRNILHEVIMKSSVELRKFFGTDLNVVKGFYIKKTKTFDFQVAELNKTV